MSLLKRKLSLILIPLLLVVSFLAHGLNMFRFPYYENDEGVYMSQAWAVLTQSKLAPYTYWYDHAPMGWLTIAVWTKFTGGFYTFGQSVNTGRVYMLCLQLINTALVFYICKRLTKKTIPAFLAALIFAISPLGIYFHRRILLDNIMTTFVLLSYALILKEKITLLTIFFSSIVMAAGILTKENAIFFIPGFLITLFAQTKRSQRPIAIAGWVTVVGSIVSIYFLFALIKGEFFPVGSALGGTKPHVSLLTTLAYQASRKGGGLFDSGTWASGSNFRLWINQDPILTLGGFGGFILESIYLVSIGIRYIIHNLQKHRLRFSRHSLRQVIHDFTAAHQVLLLIGLFFSSLGFFYFLGRGGIVIEFYVVPIIPFLALLLGTGYMFIENLLIKLIHRSWVPFIVLTLCSGLLIFLYKPYIFISRSFPQQSGGENIYTTDQTKSQRDALEWIRNNIKENEVLIFDNYAYLDLKDPNNPGKKVYKNSNWYWKVDLDPEIRDGVYNNTPEVIDYVAVTPQMNADLNIGVSPLTHEAISSGHLVQTFEQNGWSVNILRSTFPKQILARSWEWYKTAFIEDGRVVDHSNNEVSTSEGQSYAMLRSVWMNDQTTFDAVWKWTKEHLQNSENLFSWRWTPETQSTAEGDLGTAPDANIDIALSLLFASKQWSNKLYKDEAEKILQGIWNQEVGYINGKPYLSAGNWAISSEGVIINPSYFSPYAFRIFSEATPEIPWMQLVDTSYDMLRKCTEASLNTPTSVFLPPEWCIVTSGGIVSLPTAAGISSSDYSYNAFRVPFRVALDYQWYQEPRAKDYLTKMEFLFKQWKDNQKLVAIYSHDGQPKVEYEAVPAYAGSLGAIMIGDTVDLKEYYNLKLRGRFYEVDGKSFWDDPQNSYTQNWGWFGTGLYSKQLVNLWK